MNFMSENPPTDSAGKSMEAALEETQRHERAVNAFEYAAWHLGSAFARWRRDCLASIPASS